MINLVQNKTTAEIAKELEQDLRLAIGPKENHVMERAGLWNRFSAIVESILALGAFYETQAFMVEGSLVSKSQYLVPKFLQDVANSQVLWFNGDSTLRKPLLQAGVDLKVQALPSEVEYFFNAAGIKISNFECVKHGIFDFSELGVDGSDLTIQLGGSLSNIPLAILGIVGSSVDVIHFNTGVKPSKEEIKQWIKIQTKEQK